MKYLIAFLFGVDAILTLPSFLVALLIIFFSENEKKTDAWLDQNLSKKVHYFFSLIIWGAVAYFIAW